MEGFKNILFDLGAVLIDIDFNKVARAFENLGIEKFEQQFSQLNASRLFENLEMGKISEAEFHKAIQQQTGKLLSATDINNAWNAILMDFRKESMDFLSSLKNNYALYLLSNTNAIHLIKVNEILEKQMGVQNLDIYFHKAYYSHKIGLRKPGKESFQFVLNDAKIKAEETFFIDDTLPNILSAQELGFKTHHLLPGERVENIIK
jgi:HAD superfamily hydrolase (TIGR01509 family)